MPRLSARLGHDVLLKREDLQAVFSFKLRGAYNKMAGLPREALERGVICASAGNHAQGVALAAQKLGVTATIVMPRTTPSIKIAAVKARGATVVLQGDAFDEAYRHALDLCSRDGLTFVHPYDDPDVIAGQGTIGMEILQQHPGPLDAIFVPVGGGGLAAGVVELRQVPAARRQGDRRRARRCGQHGGGPRGRRARDARPRRPLRRRGRGAPGGGRDVPHLPHHASTRS